MSDAVARLNKALEGRYTIVQGVERLFDASPYSTNNDQTWHYYDVTSDDQRFVMVRPETSGDDESARLILVQNFFEELEQRVGN